MTDEIRPTRRGLLAAIGAGAVAGCVSLPSNDATPTVPTARPGDVYDRAPPVDPEWKAPSESPLDPDIEPTTLVENLEIPWDLAFTPDGEMFLTQRTGSVLRIDGDATRITEPKNAIDAGSIPPGSDESSWWVDGGEGGTMGVAVHPDFPDPAHIYVYYTANVGGEKENRLVRYDVAADDPGATGEPLLTGVPASNIHNGGRIDFGPEGQLWICVGDAGEKSLAQDPGSLAGSILRVTPEGGPAPDNPSIEGGDSRVYTYGHRNPQGITWLPDGTPLASEHGEGRDEVQILRAGANYGWPVARTEDAYGEHAEFHRPLLNTGLAGDTWAPSGCVFYTGDALPEWRNRLLIGTLIGQHINVVTLTPDDGDAPPLDGGDAHRFDANWLSGPYVPTSHKTFVDELGRVRLVTQGPDGGLYAITSNRDGRAQGPFPTERGDRLIRLA